MDAPVTVSGRGLTREDVVRVARHRAPVTLDAGAVERLGESRARVEALLGGTDDAVGITHQDRRVLPLGLHRGEGVDGEGVAAEQGEEAETVAYGVTTGFGDLAHVRIAADKLEALQENLLLSHACGVGEPLPEDVVRAMLLLRANALAVGLSGVRPVVVEHLLHLLNRGVHPVVPSRGSLGASGDLVPLAHMSLVLTGRGEAVVDGERVDGAEALRRAGLQPLRLQAKEGLALINGTQLMASLLALGLEDAWRALRTAEVAGAMTLEALLGSVRPMDARVHAARPHTGQAQTAEVIRKLTADSAIIASHVNCDRVQDAYSLRCMPQVLGAARTALAHADEVLAVELNSATDNPLIFEDGSVISGGNFHGEPLALVAAYVAAAMSEVASISERRVARLVDPHLSGLPPFLARDPGVESGLMIPQYVAAGLVMENRVLAQPAVTDSIPTSANQEDHVSNGAVQCLHLARLLENVERVIGIELLTAAQALDHRTPLKPGKGTAAAHTAVRAVIPHHDRDRLLSPDLHAGRDLVRSGRVLAAASDAAGPLP